MTQQYDLFAPTPQKPEKGEESFFQGDAREYVQLVSQELARRYETPPLAYVHSYGCQQNVSDGERYSGLLAEMGYGFTDRPEEAELILLNTCAVRENAEKRVLGNIGAMKHYKEHRPNLIIAVVGCMTQQQHIADRLKKSYRHVDLVLGTNAFIRLPALLFGRLAAKNQRYFKGPEDSENSPIIEGLPVRREGTPKAWVTVMYGCDNFCSYCIVPYVRGRERSRESASVIQEVRQLVSQGCRDITLLGQNVNSYGKGLEEKINFSTLLRRLNDEVEGDFRIRFMTSHPRDCTRELIDAIADCPKVCKHLHLPVQSGSDRVLKEMNRHYTTEHYLELIQYAKERVPGISLTSDIIVGFPGEAREDFEKTLELIKQVGYTSLFTFLYSRRSGTKAEKLPDVVTAEEKSKWFQELLDLQGVIGQEIMDSYVGRRLRVLPEGPGREEGTLTSRSDGNLIVEFPGDPSLVGNFVEVQITGAMNWALKGEVVK